MINLDLIEETVKELAEIMSEENGSVEEVVVVVRVNVIEGVDDSHSVIRWHRSDPVFTHSVGLLHSALDSMHREARGDDE